MFDLTTIQLMNVTASALRVFDIPERQATGPSRVRLADAGVQRVADMDHGSYEVALNELSKMSIGGE